MHNPLEDKYAITELIARYNQSLDCGDYKTWMTRWSEDAIFDGIGKLLVGKAQIQTFADNYESRVRSKIHALKHFTVNVLSVVEGDIASSSAYLQLVSTTPMPAQHLAQCQCRAEKALCARPCARAAKSVP